MSLRRQNNLKQIFDPFSQTRLGNESNPFVVDARVAHVPVHDDILKIIKNLMTCESYINLFKKHFRL